MATELRDRPKIIREIAAAYAQWLTLQNDHNLSVVYMRWCHKQPKKKGTK